MTESEKEGQLFFQLQEPVRNEKVAVANTSKVIAEARNSLNKRKFILIRNTSTNANEVITCHMGQNVAQDNIGIVLRQYESFMDSNETGYECHQGVITGICAVAGPGQLSITER